MSLLIEKNLSGILGTLDVSTLYLRIQCHLKYKGDQINVYDKIYLDKSSYQDGSLDSNISVDGIPNKFNFEYNRNSDGSDILVFAHEKIIEQLTTEKTEWFPQTDPSTGEQMYDSSTGEPLLIEEVVVPKFCELSEISIIDVSLNV